MRDPQETGRGSAAKAVRAIVILYVEDDQLVADMVRDTLELKGWRVETCTEDAAARRILARKQPYDLLIFDYDLPGQNGIELLRYARALPHRWRLPAIMLSASDVEPQAWRVGANAFLRKPENINQLTSLITRLLTQKK